VHFRDQIVEEDNWLKEGDSDMRMGNLHNDYLHDLCSLPAGKVDRMGATRMEKNANGYRYLVEKTL
jgi:hypothetical protein